MTNKINELLKAKEISKVQFSKDMGVTYNTILNWVKSDNISPKKQLKIAKYLKVKVSDIFQL